MITRAQVDCLLQFQNDEFLTTSCYLDLDRAKWPPQMLKIRVKDLLQSAQQALADRAGSPDQHESLHADFEWIWDHVLQELFTNHNKGLALFSCAAHKFGQTYGLPRIMRNLLIADRVPHIRPLMAILAEHHRFCIVLIDRRRGQIFEMYMGDLVERTDVIASETRRVKDGGYDRRAEQNMEHPQAQAVHQHYQRLADATFNVFKRDEFDFLILGGPDELLSEFKQHLHPFLQERWVGDFQARPFTTLPAEVRLHALKIENSVEQEHEKRMAEELVHKVEAGDLAVSGVPATLNAIASGEAQTLLVEEGFETPGHVCYDCHHVSLDEGECPNCHKPLDPSSDIIDEAIELALEKDCQIAHVRGQTALHDTGRIGVILRQN